MIFVHLGTHDKMLLVNFKNSSNLKYTKMLEQYVLWVRKARIALTAVHLRTQKMILISIQKAREGNRLQLRHGHGSGRPAGRVGSVEISEMRYLSVELSV